MPVLAQPALRQRDQNDPIERTAGCNASSGSTCIATCVISPVVSNFSRLQRKFWLNPAPTYPQAKSYPQDADLQAVDKSGMSDIAYSQE